MDAFQLYKQSFIRDFNGPFVVQMPGEKWHTRKHTLSDTVISDHLCRQYWVGTHGAWYPQFGFLDFDFSGESLQKRTETVWRAIDKLSLSANQYHLMTSPSYSHNGSCHLIFRPVYGGEIPTLGLLQKSLRALLENICEIYPQKHHRFRLPFGKNQYLIGPDGKMRANLTWKQALRLVCKLDVWQIPQHRKNFIYGTDAVIEGKSDDDTAFRALPANTSLEEAETLLRAGLQAKHSRHFSQWKLIKYFYRNNWIPDDAEQAVKRWIREKHNNFSTEAASGKWSEIDEEIERQTAWIYENSGFLPDTLNNLKTELTRSDLKLAAAVYRSDTINQKRLVDFIAYCRPRAHHDWIFIPYHEWTRIAGKNYYRDFIKELEKKNIIIANWNYRHNPQSKADSFCRKFKLKIRLQDDEPIRVDNLNVTDFYEAWLVSSGGNVPSAAEQTGLTPQRFYNYKATVKM